MKALKVKTRQIKDLTLSISKSMSFYDVILEGTRTDLLKARQKLKSNAMIMDKGIFGQPIVVLDTCDTLKDANVLYEIYLDKL